MKPTAQSISSRHPRVAAAKIGPADTRYADLVNRGFNKRFTGKPEYVRLVGSTEQVVDALQEAVREGRRVVVRSGGHCQGGFVADPAGYGLSATALVAKVFFRLDVEAVSGGGWGGG